MNLAKFKNNKIIKKIFHMRLPYFKTYAELLVLFRTIIKFFFMWLKNVLFFDQMIRYQCNEVGRNIFFWGTYPLIQNKGYIKIGDNVSFVGRNNIIVGFNIPEIERPTLIIGNNVNIGFGCEINVGEKVIIGDNVLIATGVRIFDNNSHPTNPVKRINREPLSKDDIAPVIIEDNVWIGTGALILKGVRIGKGSVVGACSVVTKDVPENVIVVGNPARIVKEIK